MSSGRKCKNCGGSDIEVDSARGDAVCTACGSVVEDNIIVAEVQFSEEANGTSSAIGQFVSADSKGGPTKFGAFHMGDKVESKEITVRKARNGISRLCSQLRLDQHYIDTACRFFKLALMGNLTRGRRNTHVHGACVYLTCRTEGTARLKEYYRGFTIIWLRNVCSNSCFFITKSELQKLQIMKDKRVKDSVKNFCSGGLLGIIMSTLFYPMKVMKIFAHEKIGGPHYNVFQTAAAVYKQKGGGLKNFYPGVAMNGVRSLLSWGITNMVFEFLKNVG